MKKKLILLLLTPVLSCIDPVSFDFKGQTEHIVIEGKWSDQPEDSYVKITMSRPFTTPYQKIVDDAVVYLVSDQGERYNYQHVEGGIYWPDEYYFSHDIVGKTYTLHVLTTDGKEYESKPVTVKPVPQIDSLYYSYDEREIFEIGTVRRKWFNGYTFYVNYSDPAGVNNFYRWSYTDIYEVLTQPALHMIYNCRGCPKPDPLPCCAKCWVDEKEHILQVESDRLSDGRKVTGHELKFFPFERYMHFKFKYKVYQYAISEEAFLYYDALIKQSKSEGSIFDPPPTQLKGNIFNINDSEDQVLGFFEAAAASVKEIVVTRSDVPYDIPFFDYPDDCQTLPNSTTSRPIDW